MNALCEVSREGSDGGHGIRRRCPVCATEVVHSARARYCSRACQQRAYRLRQEPGLDAVLEHLAAELGRGRALVSQTVYECPEVRHEAPLNRVG